MIKEDAGRVINIAKENKEVPGCTVSKQVFWDNDYGLYYFSLSKGTNISAESYQYSKLCMVVSGDIEIFDANENVWKLNEQECFIFPKDIPVGVRTSEGGTYIELGFRKDSNMNERLKAGEIFKLADLLPYEPGKIINMDLVDDKKMKYVLMSFDAGTALSEHAAPGEALVFALDGEGIINYEGKDFHLKAGETFKFDKNGKHSVKAETRFKMALLLVFD